MRTCHLVVALTAFLFAGSSAGAADFYEKHRGWVIVAGDSGCGMTMEYEGPGATNLILLKDIDGEIGVGVTNSNWTAEVGEKYDVSFHLNGKAYGGGAAYGYKSGYRKGFMLSLESSFEADFRKGESLWIYLGDTKIDQLSLDGTSLAFASINRCLKLVKAENDAEAREKARWADIPKDPFAKTTSSRMAGRGPSDPKPKQITRWIRSYDYPSAALSDKREGATEVKIGVAIDGVATSCEVTKSSGHDDLDAATCTAIMRRASFYPATDAKGNFVEGSFTNTIRWQIPEPPPEPKPPITCVAGEICKRN